MGSAVGRMLAVAGGLVLLGGCHGASFISTPNYGRYAASEFAYAAGDRDLLVEVRGNPSTLPDAVFRQAVVAAMQGTKPGIATHFTLTPGPSARPAYRVVLLFDAPDIAGGPASCRADPPRAAVDPRGRRLSLVATFCAGEEALSDLTASGAALGPEPQAQLRAFMGSVIPILLPVESPLLLNASDDFPG